MLVDVRAILVSKDPLCRSKQGGRPGIGEEPHTRQGDGESEGLPWVWRVWRQGTQFRDPGREVLTEVVTSSEGEACTSPHKTGFTHSLVLCVTLWREIGGCDLHVE